MDHQIIRVRERKQIWQNFNNWWIWVNDIWVLIVLFLQTFCRFDIFQNRLSEGNFKKIDIERFFVWCLGGKWKRKDKENPNYITEKLNLSSVSLFRYSHTRVILYVFYQVLSQASLCPWTLWLSAQEKIVHRKFSIGKHHLYYI